VFKTIVLGADHRGYALKEQIKEYLTKTNKYIILDVGAFSVESVDYPNIAKDLSDKIDTNINICGITICGSGIGINIAVNKTSKNIRAALVYNEGTAKTSREHNNANVISLGADYVDLNTAIRWIDIFLNQTFEGGRHQKRIDIMGSW
jgi:ribose 5-phosphate isomerase B